MELLRYFLLFTGLTESAMLYKLYLLKDVAKHIEGGFMQGEVTTPSTVFLYGFVLLTLMFLRLHLVMDMSNKNLYRVVLWIHIFEAFLFVGVPFYFGTLIPTHPVVIIILATPIWMTISYKSYLYPKKEHQK